MAGYSPLKVAGFETGLVQEREEFILPNDAYPVLENAFVWRERIKRKQGYQLLGRLRRILAAAQISAAYSTINGTNTISIFTGLMVAATEPNAEIELGNVTTITIAFGAPISQTLTDSTGTGVLTGFANPITAASINYATGVITITANAALGPSAVTITGAYYPGLPVMGLRTRELNGINVEQLVAFDQKYAYIYNFGWQEFIPGTTWTGNDSNFFWSTNYWVDPSQNKLFWVTNFSNGDPIRFTNGTNWENFSPSLDSTAMPNKLQKCLALLPFRGRLVAFNTMEGQTLGTAVPFRQRIRWSAIGNPISDVGTIFPIGTVNPNAWNDSIRGQGGFLDIPTAQDIISVGFVRDNLVIYTETSTWQLRYTGRAIQPFQIERVNSELGAESTFSAVQFDTSLVGVGDKGIVECDSFKSDRIDIKIPDLIFQFNQNAQGPQRVHGIRDFQQRLAYWIYPYVPDDANSGTYPNRRLVYNYENDSWAIFTDSLTALGTYQPTSSRKWSDFTVPVVDSWEKQNYSWINRPLGFPSIVGGNQQGFVEFLDQQTTNDNSLSITGITGNSPSVTVITSPNHNLQDDQIIQISQIPVGTPFDNLNFGIFQVSTVDSNSFRIFTFSPLTGQFNNPQVDAPATYVGGGKIAVRDNFRIVSKKFNSIDEGQKIQLGYLDVLMENTFNGAITLNVYMDYNDDSPVNQPPQNVIPATNTPDGFFNVTVPTSANTFQGITGSKNWQRVFCPTRAQFITLEWTFSNAQMAGNEQTTGVQIDAQILWLRNAGRLI